ncbi:hypothetical protein G5C51_16790 [Streptomyces sp. A7024]|uniref:Secreted protein n=1 Tax=Streptomyces coryli TaxID=1128680 RepID=A0A6G4U2E8_9ACTN|nr:hypothetical protein [Streptomyces coryli]
MNGLRALVVSLVIACTAVVCPAAQPATAAVAPSWSALPVPPAAPDAWVSDLAARGAGEAWATGSEPTAEGRRPLLYRGDGAAWSRDTTFPGADGRGYLGTVQFVGDEVWILRGLEGPAEILRRSAGGSWSTIPVPQELWWYQGFTAVPGAAWVTGEDSTGMKLLHYDGSGWTDQAVPDGVLSLMGITARTATDAWAWANSATGGGDIVLHWNGKAWRDAKVPLPPSSSVHQMLLEPGGRVTISGRHSLGDGAGYRTFVMTGDGRTWRTTYPVLPDNAYTENMARGPDGALWLPLISDRAFQSKYARIDGRRVSYSYGPERTNAIEVSPDVLARAGSSLLSFGTVEIYGSKPNLMSERLGG